MQKPEFVSLIILFECIVSIACCCYALFIFTGMLLNSKSNKFNWSMKIYATFQIIQAALSIIYLGYLSVLWRLQNPVYDIFWIYWTGGIQNTFHIISSLTVCVLGIDRCLLVRFPRTNLTIIPLIIFALMVTIWSVVNISMRMVPVYPKNAIDKKDCENFGCLGSYYTNIVYYFLRFVASGINFAVGIMLTVLLKRMPIISKHTIKSSKTTLYAIIATLTFDLLPHFLSIILYEVFRINFGDYVGPYSTIFGALENAVCAFLYRSTFKIGAVLGQTTSSTPHQAASTPTVMINSTRRVFSA